VFGLWLTSLVRKIFLSDIHKLRLSDVVDWKQVSDISGNFLVVGPAESGKSGWLRAINGVSSRDYFDLRVELKRLVSGGAYRNISGKGWAMRLISGGAYPNISGKGPVVLVDHFEFNLKDRDYNMARLNLLEYLLYKSDCRIVLVSSVDPLYFLTEGAPDVLSDPQDPELSRRLLDRWTRVMSKFETVRIGVFRDLEFGKKIRLFIQNHRNYRDFALCVWQECKRTAKLRRIGMYLLDNFEESDARTRAWVEASVLDRATEYYRVLWSGLTATERLALYQLALDGWVNPKNTAALQQLESKLLICRVPIYRIMNVSFRKFVSSPEHASEIEQWEKQRKQSTWRVLRLFLVGVAAIAGIWLLHSQAALSHELAAYIAAVATLLTAISALFGRSGKQAPAKPEPS
jgi:hypothetical protein